MYNRDSRIMRKLLGKSAPDSSAGDIAIASGSATINATYRPTKSQNAVHPVGVPIACLDVSPDRHHVVLGGPHILKALVSDFLGDNFSFRFKEGVDIRAAITAQKSLGSSASLVADQLNIRDVKWHGSSTVLTACAAGRIFAYDIARLSTGGSDPLDYIQMQEDARQVNTLEINPHLHSWLLSGSQDGMVRVFDLSGPTQNRAGFLTFRQRYTPLKTNDAIRQVKWSPKQGYEMACCTDAGTILKWDVRQPSRPLLRINAHDKVCSSIAWHPDGTHLISAGWDTKLHVWDLGGKADKRQKPKYTISTPAPVTAVAWRPALWSATAQTRRLAQVAVTYDESSNKKYGASVVQIWDLARPAMPYKEIERFDNSPASLFWHDQDLLWTVGRDGIFNQCDVAFAPKVIDRQSTSAMAFSSRGDVVMFLDERPLAPRPQANVTREPDVVPRTPFGSVPNTPMLSVSRSDSEEDVMPTFLGPRRRSLRRRRLSGRSGLSISTTPPSTLGTADDGKQVLGLEESINVTGMFKTQQGMASGHVPAAKSVHVYHYLSGVYLETLQRELPSPAAGEGRTLVDRVSIILEHFAKAAENVRLYRLSQTWRILAFAMSLWLEKRAGYHLQIRVARSQRASLEEIENAAAHDAGKLFRNLGPGEADHIGAGPLVSEEGESTSNVPTPLARPVDGAQRLGWENRHYEAGNRLTPIAEPDNLSLGPSIHGNFESPRQRLDSAPISDSSQDSDYSKESVTEGYDFYDAEALTRALDASRAGGSRETHWELDGRDAAQDRPTRESSDNGSSREVTLTNGPDSLAARQPSSADDSVAPDSLRLVVSDLECNAIVPSTESPDGVFITSQTTMSADDGLRETQASSQRTLCTSQSDSDPPDLPVTQPRCAKTRNSTPPLEQDPSPHIIEHDYFPWKGDPPFPFLPGPASSKTPVASPSAPVSPLNPYTLLARALEFETRTSALNASAMVLLLKPLVPDSVIDTYQATAILRQHHSRLMGMGLFVEAALLRNLCVKGWPAGLPDWGETYTALVTCAQQGVTMGLFCASCSKPREVDPSRGAAAVWTCERCHRVAAPCAVCGHREPEPPSLMPPDAPAPDPWLTVWWYCPGCAHGGHASCLQAWHAPARAADASPATTYSDGCCPSDGCGHACLPGRYRAETTAARAAADSARVRDEMRTPASRRPSPARMPISGDANDVPQSKAVGIAREALNSKATGGILSSSPGRPTLPERERRKSVKFAKPER